jgi:hypothetical protein
MRELDRLKVIQAIVEKIAQTNGLSMALSLAAYDAQQDTVAGVRQ